MAARIAPLRGITGFLDDRLACGDSLLGLVSLDQLETLHVDPAEGRRLHHGTLDFTEGWRSRLAEAADLRRRITTASVVTIRDIEHKSRLLARAEKLSGTLQLVSNAVAATGVAAATLRGKKLDGSFLELSVKVSNAMEDGPEALVSYVKENLQDPRPVGTVNVSRSTGPSPSPKSSPTPRTLALTQSSATPPRSRVVRGSPAPSATIIWCGYNAGTETK